MSNSRKTGPRKASRWSQWFQKRSQLRRELRRPNVETLEERRLMAAVPYSDGLYYPLAGKNAAFLPGNISYQEYVRRANLTNGLSGGGGSSGGNSFSEPDGLAPVIAFNTMEIEPNDFLSNAQLLPLGTVPGKSQTVTVAGIMSQVVTIFDEDYYAVDLRAGDIFDARVTGGLTTSFDLSLNDASNRTLIASRLPFPVGTPIYPANSPLSTDGAVNLSYVIPASGRYYVRVSDGLGPYNLRLQAFRNTMEQQGVGTKQIVFVDFDGATIRGDIYGIPGTLRIPSLIDSLTPYGIRPSDIDPIINKAMAQLQEDFTGSLPSLAQNGWYSGSGVPGQFDIEFRNSRDHADPWGLPNVTRYIVGGDRDDYGFLTYGVTESVDVGNYDREETAIFQVEEIFNPFNDLAIDIDLIPRSPSSTLNDLIGHAIGFVGSHELGHALGGFHTDATNLLIQIMDSGGGPFATQQLWGLGLDGIYGTADDVDIDFGTDRYEPLELLFLGQQDSAATVAFGLSTGTRGGFVTGRVYNDRNRDGNPGSGEEGLGNQIVYADYNRNELLDAGEPRTLTNADGSYRLTVAPGTWNVRSITYTNWLLTGQTSRSVTVGLDQTVANINFGQYLPNQFVSGFKWSDTNGNGIRDNGEPGLGGLWVYVDLDGDDRIDIGEPSAKTNDDGSYNLTPPTSGTFAIREVVPPGYVQTYPNAAANFEHVVTFNGTTPLRGIDFGNLPARDYGDAPSPYPTLASSNGPSHGFDGNLRLGANFDFEGNGQPNATARGDDDAGQLDSNQQVIDDEDGVVFTSPIVANSSQNRARISVYNASNSVSYLSGWVDFNRDGDWNDAGEKILSDVIVNSSGQNDYTFTAPAGALLGTTFARFRLSATAGLGVTGPANNGEVEDYAVTVYDREKYAIDDSYTVNRNSVANLLDVQANDFMRTVPGESALITRVTQGSAGGTVTTDGQVVRYTPRSGFTGLETFTYTVLTSTGKTDTANVTVNTIFRLNDPLAVDDSFDIPTNSVAVPLNVLANDLEGITGALTISSVTNPSQGGTVVIGQGGLSLRYTPRANFAGTETFRYTAIDSAGKTTSANVTIHLVEGDRLDDVVEFSLSFTDLAGNPISAVPQGEKFKVVVSVDDLRAPGLPAEPGVYAAYLDLLYNAGLVATVPGATGSGFDFDVTFFSPYTNGKLGTAGTPGVVSEVGAFVGNTTGFNEPNPLRLAAITFEARSAGIAEFVSDPANRSPQTDVVLFDTPSGPVPMSQVRYRRASLEVVPNGVEFPFAVDDSLPTPLPANSFLNPIDVLRNDRPGTSPPVSIVSVSLPANGQAFIDDRGTTSTSDDRVLYSPNRDFQGTDQFSYTIRDSRGFNSTAKVTVQVGTNTGDDVVQFRLEATNLSGQPIDQIGVGQKFQLRGYVQQLQPLNGGQLQGVYAAYQDILYDSALVSVTPLNYESIFGFRGVNPPVPGRDYPVAPSGDLRIPGLINELGSASKELANSTNLPGGAEKLQFIIEVTALTAGTATFLGDPADISPLHDSLVFDPAIALLPNQIRYLTETLTIGNSIVSGEGFTNLNNRFDVNNDGAATPIDALIIINSLSRGGTRALAVDPNAEGEGGSKMFIDVNGDGFLSPIDVLQVINAINRPGEGEGEAAPAVTEVAAELDSSLELAGAIDLLAQDIQKRRR
jgi:hypothetical protein